MLRMELISKPDGALLVSLAVHAKSVVLAERLVPAGISSNAAEQPALHNPRRRSPLRASASFPRRATLLAFLPSALLPAAGGVYVLQSSSASSVTGLFSAVVI